MRECCVTLRMSPQYDPEGLNREELTRLANARIMIEHFDVAKLGPKGFRVLINDRYGPISVLFLHYTNSPFQKLVFSS